jgi:hypothetical protein
MNGIKGWVCLRVGLDVVEKENIPCLCRESNRESSAVQTVTYPLYRLSYLDVISQ